MHSYMTDVKVRVDALNSFYYPDIVVDCAKFDQSSVFTDTPVLIFEVLSQSTATTDRREKLVAYQSIDTLMEYVIVHQARKRLEVYRNAGDNWTVEELGGSESLTLNACPGCELAISMDEIYAGIEFDPPPQLQVREDVEVYMW